MIAAFFARSPTIPENVDGGLVKTGSSERSTSGALTLDDTSGMIKRESTHVGELFSISERTIHHDPGEGPPCLLRRLLATTRARRHKRPIQAKG